LLCDNIDISNAMRYCLEKTPWIIELEVPLALFSSSHLLTTSKSFLF